MIDIALLGTGGNMPMPDRFLSSALISYKGRKILIDCGEGTQVSMRMLKWGFKSIDIILITHEHGDHVLGLPGLLSTIANSERESPITIMGPKGIEAVVRGLTVPVQYIPYGLNIIETGERDFFVYFNKEGTELREDVSDSGYFDLRISTIELDHSVPCIGYGIYVPRKPKFSVEKAISNGVPKFLWKALQDGKSVTYEGILYHPGMVLEGERRGIKLSYITDTRPIGAIIPFIKGSDIFICEGTYGHEEDHEKAVRNKHMTFSEAASLAQKGDVKQLLLTHFSPSLKNPGEYLENARNIFKNTCVAWDRLVRSIKFEES
ncbi:MAG TPA: ribonuclease Z [Tissierellia bacterium]|nr:ribonuclease Z [Tissierellia bacterium]